MMYVKADPSSLSENCTRSNFNCTVATRNKLAVTLIAHGNFGTNN
jgi:hypothetical protein